MNFKCIQYFEHYCSTQLPLENDFDNLNSIISKLKSEIDQNSNIIESKKHDLESLIKRNFTDQNQFSDFIISNQNNLSNDIILLYDENIFKVFSYLLFFEI